MRKLPLYGSSPRAVHIFYTFSLLDVNADSQTADKKIRDKATDSLILFLQSKTDLSLLELLKLWKGLFFCTSSLYNPLGILVD